MKLGDLPRWLAFNFSVKDLSVALGNIDSSSRMDKRPRGCRKLTSSVSDRETKTMRRPIDVGKLITQPTCFHRFKILPVIKKNWN